MENPTTTITTLTENQRNAAITSIIKGIEKISKNHHEVKYNLSTLEKVYRKVEEGIANSTEEIKNIENYAIQCGYYWAIDEIRLLRTEKNKQEKEKDKERKTTETRIQETIMETRSSIAKQELKLVVFNLLETAKLTETQRKQLKYLLISFMESYEAADEAFSDSSNATKRQWRKRARKIILKQTITDNLRSLLDTNHSEGNIKFVNKLA